MIVKTRKLKVKSILMVTTMVKIIRITVIMTIMIIIIMIIMISKIHNRIKYKVGKTELKVFKQMHLIYVLKGENVQKSRCYRKAKVATRKYY